MQITTTDKTRSRIYSAILILVIIASGCIIYSNSLHCSFVFDDHGYILKDPACRMTRIDLKSLEKAAFESKPAHRLLPNISFALNYYFGRYNTFGYHLFNTGVHLICGILLFLFIKSTLIIYYDDKHPARTGPGDYALNGNPELIAFFAALIWLVHPVATESVTYIVQRMTSMAAMFYILSFLLYVRGRAAMIREGNNRTTAFFCFTGCVVSGICAIMSKQNTATLPLFILLYEWFFFQNLELPHNKKKIIAVLAALILFSGTAILYLGENPFHRILASYTHRDFTLVQRVMTEWRVVVYYISLMVWPSPARLNLDIAYPLSHSFFDPITTATCLAAILALFYISIIRAKKDRLISFCILWFLGNLVIESSVIGIEIIFEHRTYLPFMMAGLIPVILLFRYIRQRRIVFVILCAVTLLFSVWTYQRNSVWQNPVTFWADCLQKSADKSRVYKNMAYSLQQKGETGKAIGFYKKALEIGRPDSSTYGNLGTAMMSEKRYIEAAGYYSRALLLNPNNAEIHKDLAMALFMSGNFTNAQNEYEKALLLKPDYVYAKIKLKRLKQFLSRFPAREQEIPEMIRQYPENPAFRLKQGMLYEKKEETLKAIKSYKTALSLLSGKNGIDFLEILTHLAAAEAAAGRYGASIAHFKRLIQLLPENAMFYYNVAALYAVSNRTGDAMTYLKKAAGKGLNVDAKTSGRKVFARVRDLPEYVRLFGR